VAGDELSEAFNALLDAVRDAERRIVDADPPLDDVERAEGYRWLFTILGVGLDAHVWADTDRPLFVEIVGPTRKWGGDNADAFYRFVPLDPARTYVVRGRRGDAAYLSLTVYGGPDDGRYSERIVGQINDRSFDVAEDGTFEITLSPDEQPGAWIRLEPDAVCALTRDYLADPATGRRAEWSIEAVDPPATTNLTAAGLARGLRHTTTWLVEQAQMCPIRIEPANEVQEPYPVPATTFGWAAGDAAYAMGSYELDDRQALVIEGRSPECAFWNLCLWNPFLHTFDYRYEPVTINGAQAQLEPDGSWRLVVADRDPGMPNWVHTQGHPRGLLWFRWFLPDGVPERPRCRVIDL
jgi:hypothetical protein